MGKPSRRPLRHQAGFTLAELLVVLLLTSLFLGIGLPVYPKLLDDTRLTKAAATMAADIRRVQERAQREGRPARIAFDRNHDAYYLQLANDSTATVNCSDANYTTIQTVDLSQLFQVRFGPTSTWSCITFAASGRTAWKNPTVITDSAKSVTPDGGVRAWFAAFNGNDATTGPTVANDGEALVWTDLGNPIQITVDLQASRYLESVCAHVLEDAANSTPLPDSIQLEWSPDGTSWSAPSTRNGPFSKTPVNDVTDYYQACPEFTIGDNVMRLRFTFTLHDNGTEPGPPPVPHFIMALDEIKLPPPFVTLQPRSGRTAKKLTITPITGKVTIQ